MKIANVSTFGSCSSRNIFNSNINKDYKNYFKIHKSSESTTLISLMSNPVEYDKNLINSESKYDNVCVNDDLSKDFLKWAEKDIVDYIILDTFFDVASSILFYDKNSYITLNGRIKRTDFYDLIKNKRHINIFDNFNEYSQLWKTSCDKFFNFIDENCTNTKIILNCSRLVYKYYDLNWNVKTNVHFEKTANRINPLRDLLDTYILENYDVEILKFNPNTYADEHHNFGLDPNHFEEKYYLEKNQQLLNILSNNEQGFYKDFNVENRKKQKEELIKTFSSKKFDFDYIKKLENQRFIKKDKIENKLKKYNTARIDLKNDNKTLDKNMQNTVKIESYSDLNMQYYYPEWFKDSKGKGLIINSLKNFLKINIVTSGEGELNINLRSVDYRLKGKRMPIYINYTKFFINDEEIFSDSHIVDHDHPFIYKLPVKDKQKLSLYLEWLSY